MDLLFPEISGWNEWTIVEPSEVFAAHAQASIVERTNVNVFLGMFENKYRELMDKKFDVIIVSSLLHELEFPEKFLRCVWELCSEQTVVHINVPNANSIHRLLAEEACVISDRHELSGRNIVLQQQRVFDMNTLSTIVDECGFNKIDAGSYFPKFFTHAQMQKMLDSEILSESIIAGMAQMIKYMPDNGSEIYINVKKKF